MRHPAASRRCPGSYRKACGKPNVEGSINCVDHDAPDRVSRLATCAVCGGGCAQKRSAGAFVDDVWLHLYDSDWTDNPHNAQPTNIRTIDRGKVRT